MPEEKEEAGQVTAAVAIWEDIHMWSWTGSRINRTLDHRNSIGTRRRHSLLLCFILDRGPDKIDVCF
jgi:hypothetical protein